MKALTSRQSIILMLVTIIATKFFIVPIKLAEGMEQNIILVMPIFILLEIALIILLVKFSMRYSNWSFYEILENSFGKIFAKVFFILLFIFFLGKNILNINETYSFFLYTLYEDLNPLLYIIPLSLLMFYGFLKGLNSIGRTLEILCKILLFGIITAIIIGISSVDFSNLLPLFEPPIENSLFTLQENIFWFGDYFVFLIILGDIKYNKGYFKHLMWVIIGAFIILLTFYITYFCLFPFSSGIQHFAVSDITQYTSMGDWGRIDWLTSFIWTMASILQAIIYYYCSTKCLQYIFKFKNDLYTNILSLTILLIFVLLINFNFSNTIAIAQGPIRFLVPILAITCFISTPIQNHILKRKNIYEKQSYPRYN